MEYDEECREIGCHIWMGSGDHKLQCPKHPDAGKLDPHYQRVMDRISKSTKFKEPPLGVMPKHIWLENRAQDLVRAISEYLTIGDNVEKIISFGWPDELEWVLDEARMAKIEFNRKVKEFESGKNT